MSEWEIISEQRAPQTMPPPMSPPAVDNEWEVVSEREISSATAPPPTAMESEGLRWEVVEEAPETPATIDLFEGAGPVLNPLEETAPSEAGPLARGIQSGYLMGHKSLGDIARYIGELTRQKPKPPAETMDISSAPLVDVPETQIPAYDYTPNQEEARAFGGELAEFGKGQSKYFEDQMRPHAPKIQNFTDIKNYGDFGEWALWNIGQMGAQVGMTAPFMLLGGPEAMGVKTGWDVAKNIVAGNPGRWKDAALWLGNWAKLKPMDAPLAVMEGGAITGGQLREMDKKGAELSPVRAMAATFAAAKLEELGVENMVNRVAKGIGKQGDLLARIGKSTVGTSLSESAEEFFQTYAEQFGIEPDDLLTKKTFMEAVNGAAAGAIGGFAMGPIGGIKKAEGTDIPPPAPTPEDQPINATSPALSPDNLRWLIENKETLGLSDDDVAPYLKIIENATPRPTEELSGVREKMKAGEATPEEVIDAYSSKLDDIAGLMQEKEATTLEARRGRYGTPGQTALDFGTEGTPLFDATQPSPTTEKTQPAATSEGEGATKEPWQMVPAEYVGDAARDEKAVKLAAHPMHVKRALEEGKTVPLEVLDKYRNNYWAQKAIERLHGEAALKEPEAGYGEAGLDNVSKTKDNAAMSKDKGTADIPPETTPQAEAGKKILRDSLDNPSPQATLSAYGARTLVTNDGRKAYGIPEYYGLSAGSDAAGIKVPIEADNGMSYEEIKDAIQGAAQKARLQAEERGFTASERKDGYGYPVFDLIHQVTQKEYERLLLIHNKKWENARPIFVRYGKLPKGGKSKNYADNRMEKGVSVFNGLLLPSGEIMSVPKHTYELGSLLMGDLKNRPVYVVEGKVIGVGSDGEPLVSNAKLLKPTEAAKKYFPNPSRPPEVGGQTVETPTGQYGEPTAISRSAWSPDTEKSVQHTTVIAMKAQPGYKAAKEGDFVEGVKLALSLIKPQIINNLKNKLPQGARVIVVPVQSLEAQGENAIPAGMAHVIADMTGWQVAEDIFQVNKVEHTDKNALERLLNQAVYDGPVEPGTLYLIVDDVVTQGGTLANLKGFIEAKGGKVIGIHTLGAAMFSTNLKVSPATVEKLKNTYGQNLDSVLSYVYGGKTNVEHITESEARTFLNKKDELLDAARAGRLEADIQGRTPEGQGISGRGKAEAAGQLNEPQKEYRDNSGLAAQAVSELRKPTLLQRIGKALSGLGMRDRGRTAGGEPVRVPGEKAGGAEGVSRRIITLAKTVSDLKELKSIRLRGTEAATWNAVYDALRIVRNANVEILNVLYRGKTSGTILYNEAYSCRLPGSVENVSASLLAMNAVGEANKLSRIHKEEVEIILSHNHPSGDVTVSDADRKFTKEAAAAVALSKGNFAGHIVINHNKYSLVDAQGKAKPFNLPDVPEEYRNDPLLTMPVPHKALGKSATMPDHIALIARDIQRGEHYFTVLLRAGTKIRGIVNVPLDILNDKKAATEFIHELAVQHGAQDVFAYREDFTNEQKGTLINMVKENTFRDVVYDAGNVAGYFPADRRKIFGKDRTTIEAQRLEGVPQEVKGKGAVRQVDAWHGSPHTFDKFKSEKIGIGEGNQSFGWGLYFTDLEDVARHYAEKLGYGADIAINGKPIRKGENAFLAALSTDLAQATMLSSNTKAKQVAQIYIDSAIDRLENNLPYTGTKAEQAAALEYLKSMGRVESIEKKHSRNLYKVTLHKGKQPGEYTWLDWDKSVPNSIWDKMADQAEKEGDKEYGDWLRSRKDLQYKLKGEGIYLSLASHFGFGGRDIDGMREASLFLLRAGIDGIRYPAGTLTGIKSDAFNYVVFDENAVTVEEHAVYEKEGEYGDIKAEIEAEIADILDIARKNGTLDKTDTNILKEEEAPYGEEDDSFDFGANIEKAIEENPEKHISLDFKDHLEGYIGHLFNMVVAGEPGKRLTLEGMGGQDQVVSWGSTYPEFMKGQGWSAKEVLAALRHAQAGEKTTDKQKEIIRAALHQATDMFFEDMDRWAPNLSEEALEKMEASIEPAIDDFLSKYYREKREREIERQKIARTTKITKSQYDWEREKQKAKEGAWMKGFKSRQEEVNALQSELAKTEAKLQTQIAHVKKMFAGEKVKEDAWKEAERIKNTEIKKLQGEIKRLKDRLAKAKEAAAPKPKAKRLSRKGQIRIVTGQVLADDEITLREMDALKDQIRMEAAAAREAYRAGNKAGLAKARARYQSMKDILRIKRAQQADIRKMIKQMKDVAKKADQLPPEYKLAITDLLEPWDMARLTDKNRVKLQAIRDEIENNQDADFPPSMLETLKRLDKRPIRDLSYDEIQSIHRAVMHFATLGRNKIKGMAAQQRIVREMTRGVVKGEMKEAEEDTSNYDIRYSDEKKIKGFLQKAKNQFGIHLIGWEALVESVSGPRSMFYKAIYRNIKEGTIERDKAMYELEDLFLKAQEEFQQKEDIKDIADWLDADRKIEYATGKTITMSRNQLISLELGWRDADWRRSVEEGGFGLWNNPMPNDPNRVYQLGPEGIEKIIAAVTPTEREYADMAVPIIQKTGDMLADKFLEINGYEMPRTESGAYWRKDVMASERGKTDEQTELEKARLGRPGIFKGMTIQRTGDSSAVWLKPFTVAMREMSKRGADYVALEEPMSLAAWLMYDKEFRKEFDKRYGMPLWKEIEQGLKDLSDTYQPVRDTTWERVGTWLRNKSTLFALGLNYATMLKQFTGAINYLVYVDPVHLANAIVKYGTNRNDVRRLHKQMSTEYRHRREEGYSQDVGNVITSLSATGQKPSLVTRIGVAGMRPLQAIDIFGADIGMLAAVDQALDAFKAGKLTEDMKDALDMSDEDIKGMTYAEQFEAAYKWADYCTERTQNMSRPEHMSGWQRGSEFSKQFSMFMGEVQKNLTGLYRAYNKVQRGDIGAHMHLTKNILLYLVVSSLIIDAGVNAMRDILRGRRPDRWWAVGLKAITSPIPIIRDITQTAVDTAQGKGFGLSGGDTPIARFQESIAKVVVKGTKATTGKTAKERKEAATATADAILNTAALAAGLPWPAVQEPFRIAKREETARKERQRNR